ncbi:DASS family sodium-coupled anion symporter [Neorhizobium sp. JUb45]|uniref:DASS family sodium-coupled anion symporter n=1 Tax=unclassified Neorhizobium TaxID=2629175 RepID=UPI001051B646|nr:DASS family sodium-coupled anion symporter [Neorhizobium sp. JUb45]TCQ99726.1 DASS family divalent anion:Na+ symporter [Neorhizobium sp. JUb45]
MPTKLTGILTYFKQAVPFRILPAIVTTAFLITLLAIPAPSGLDENGWVMLAIFLTTILAIILKVMSIGVMAIMAIVIVSLAQVTSPSSKGAVADALSSFANPLIWLIVIAVLISLGLKKTGLGRRIGLYFIALLGKRTLGIGYGLVICELILAPFTPSNTARGGGIIHPIMKSIANAFDSDPAKGTQGRVGTYLALVNYHANPISSAMFVTATAPNPLVLEYVTKVTGGTVHLTWVTWALAMFVPGIVALLVMPLILYALSPPEMKKTPDAIVYARKELTEMGPLSGKEWVMIGTFALLLLLWANVPAMMFGPAFMLDPTVVALIGLFALLITGTLDWNDILGEKSAWDTLIWFGALVMMADQLNKLGVIGWFSNGMKDAITAADLSWQLTAAVLVAVFTFSHYMFASTTAHVSAMMLAFLTVGVMLIPAEYQGIFILMMAAGSGIMMTLTHYATGTSPIIFGSGYVTMSKWWGIGFVMCVINLAIFATVGGIWWKVLGYW